MVLADIIQGKNYPTIMVRCNYPKNLESSLSEKEKQDGMLFGYCAYIDGELISLDGDSYSLSDEIVRYESFDDDVLVVWQHATYYGENERDPYEEAEYK